MNKELELLHKEICERYCVSEEQWAKVWNAVCAQETAEPKAMLTHGKHLLCEFVPQLTSNNVVGIRKTYLLPRK